MLTPTIVPSPCSCEGKWRGSQSSFPLYPAFVSILLSSSLVTATGNSKVWSTCRKELQASRVILMRVAHVFLHSTGGTTSSPQSTSHSFSPFYSLTPTSLRAPKACFITTAIKKSDKKGGTGHSCRTPMVFLNEPDGSSHTCALA